MHIIKTIIVFILFIVAAQAQDVDSTKIKICQERGHIYGDPVSVTALGYIPQYVDLPDRTLKIMWNPNIIEYTCQRCRQTIRKQIPTYPDTIVIWQEPIEKQIK